jgi:hypothetical protein
MNTTSDTIDLRMLLGMDTTPPPPVVGKFATINVSELYEEIVGESTLHHLMREVHAFLDHSLTNCSSHKIKLTVTREQKDGVVTYAFYGKVADAV